MSVHLYYPSIYVNKLSKILIAENIVPEYYALVFWYSLSQTY